MDNSQPIVGALSASDPEIAERFVSRRAAILQGASASAAVAAGLRAASVPVALAALAGDAFGQAGQLPIVVVDVLNFALVLEEFEVELYTLGLAAPGLIPAADRPIFERILTNERAHRDFIRTTLGPSARPKPAFDFTGGFGSGRGPYRDIFTNFQTLAGVAQTSEDTGVRAYKGQAPTLIPFPDVLTAALTIHSVEARHAAELRRLRGNFMDMQPFHQGWPTGRATDVPGSAGAYVGEDNTTHLGIDLTRFSSLGVDSLTEAFDEPLTRQQVLAVVAPFLAQQPPPQQQP